LDIPHFYEYRYNDDDSLFGDALIVQVKKSGFVSFGERGCPNIKP